MSRALYQDLFLDETQVQRVYDYLHSVNFHLEGAGPSNFVVSRRARYLGYMFQAEDLEAYGVGLRCTKPGMEGYGTFIRMSRDQLLGKPNPRLLEVNDPVLATEALTLHRFYDTPAGPSRTGVDTFATDSGLAGADFDLQLLEHQLAVILAFHHGEDSPAQQEILDLKVFWGSLLAGRYSRLRHLRDRLSPAQAERLDNFEERTRAAYEVLFELDLPTFESLDAPIVSNG